MVDHDRGNSVWREEKTHIDELLYMARNLDKVSQQVERLAVDAPLIAGEHPLLVLQGSGVVELRAGGSVAQGDHRAMEPHASMDAAQPARIRHRTFAVEPGAQRLTLSGGTTIITSDRVLYASPNWNRVWDFSKTVGVFHTGAVGKGMGASYIKVSNRKKTSGFVYRSGFAQSVRDRLVLALAVADGTLDDMVQALEAERADLDRS